MLKLLRKLSVFLLLLAAVQAAAKPNLSSEKRYHLVCPLYPNGCVVDGGSAGATTPLFYYETATTADCTYWIITEQEDGQYTIQNAATGKYITYDGQRSDAGLNDATITRRYVDMTDAVDGENSLWNFQQYSEGVYAIRNVAQKDHIWDVRAGSYVVGTYSNGGSPNNNQQFCLYDDDGTLVVETSITPIDPTIGVDVTSWVDVTEESSDGWTNEGGWWVNTGAGGSHINNQTGAHLVQPFIELWRESSSGALWDNGISKVVRSLPAGKYTLKADMMACRQSYWDNPNTPAENVVFYAGNDYVNVATGNDPPEHFEIEFTLAATSDIEIGVRAVNTNANWIALDNLQLYYDGSKEDLLEVERLKVLAEIANHPTTEELEEQLEAVSNDFDQMEALRKSIMTLPTIDPLGKAAADLCIGGHPVAYSKSTNIYLCSIPLSAFDKDMTAAVSYSLKSDYNNLTIDGQETPPGSTHTFEGVAGGKEYTLTVTATNGTTISLPLTFTSLPVVQIYGSFGYDYSEGYIAVNEPDKDAAKELLDMKAKWRGGITNGGDKHKRNYHVKLKDAVGEKLERQFFGLREDNSWILESCQVDMSRIRNRTMTDLWNDFSTPPYYNDKEPKALTGTRGRFVELILNDEYRGIYCLTENLDRKQMKLKKYDEEKQQTRGQLWKSKDWSYATMMGYQPDGGYYPKDFLSDPYEYSEMWDSYEVKYPDFEDYGYQTDWSTLYGAVDFVAHATDADFKAHIAEYLDLPLVLDYYILMETILATDNHGKNMFFGVYNKQKDKKITFGVWDMDATCGQRWSDSYYHQSFLGPEQDYSQFITQYEHGDYNIFKRLRETNANDFNEKVRKRYRDLRQDELATENILKRFKAYLDEFKTSGSDQREYAKWSYDSDVAGLPLNFDDEYEYLTDWFTRRMNYLDNTRFDIGSLSKKGDVNGDDETDIADAVAIVNYLLNKPSATFLQSAADVNDDDVIDVNDAVAVLNIIVKKNTNSRMARMNSHNPE